MTTTAAPKSRVKGNIGWLLGFARPATLALTGSVLSRIVAATCAAAVLALPAWAIGETAARLTRGEHVETSFLIGVLTWFVGLSVLKALARYLEQWLGHLAAFRLLAELRIWIVDRLIPQAPAITDGLGVARLQTVAVRDVDRIEVFFAHTIAPAITAALIPTAAVATAWVMAGWEVGVTLALVMLLGVLLPLLGAKQGQAAAQQLAKTRADIGQHIADTVRLRDDIWASQAEDVRLAQLGKLDDQLSDLLQASGRRTALRHGLGQLRIWGGVVLILVVGLASAPGAVAEALPGVLLAAALVPGTMAVLDTIERLATSLPAGLEATRRIRELAAGAPAVDEPAQPAVPNRDAAGSAQLADVSFRYPTRDAKVLSEVNLDVPAGSFVGIVGATGSGKSTIARLLQRHVDPSTGSVQIGGVDAKALGSPAVAKLVAVADQEPFIASGTVADNLRLADPEASDETLAWAARIAELDLPMNRPLRHRAEDLSGGQRQRLALARTLVRVRDPESGDIRAILVLDEATSHQDSITQRRIVENIRSLGASVVMIAHRLDTLRDADQIFVLEDGRIVEHGNWDDLTAREGAFSALLAAN